LAGEAFNGFYTKTFCQGVSFPESSRLFDNGQIDSEGFAGNPAMYVKFRLLACGVLDLFPAMGYISIRENRGKKRFTHNAP
jgi:hypothetical protein